MKQNNFFFLIIMLLIMGISIGFAYSETEELDKLTSTDFDDQSNASQAPANEAFDKMMSVIAHKRCVNCHPAGDRPHQGEDSHLHRFGVQRGADGHGTAALQCNTCHQKENNISSGVPGAPHWHLAPRSMGWEGLNKIEIAKAMLDKTKNGGRSLDEIVKHLTEDDLVLWVFDPGANHE